MTYSFRIAVRMLAGEHWSGNTMAQDIYLTANLPDLGILLRVLDSSNAVQGITVFKTLVIPSLTDILRMTREDLDIQDNELMKVS